MVDFSELSDGELLELMVSFSQSMSRRLLVVWLYLQHRPDISIKEFDKMLPSLAEAELQKRAASQNMTAQRLESAADILKKLGAKRDQEKTRRN
jgi:hypothetical protein